MKTTKSNHLILKRGYTDRGTFGRIETPARTYDTLERPWAGNRAFVSCIPEGVYTLKKRRSGVVERSTGGLYLYGWEVTNVPGRTFIMFHPANLIEQLEGCIAPGLSTGVLPGEDSNPQWAILNSLAAFKMLMEDLEAHDEWTLDVRGFYPEWP